MSDLLVELVRTKRAELLGELPKRVQMRIGLANREHPAEDDLTTMKNPALFRDEDVSNVNTV